MDINIFSSKDSYNTRRRKFLDDLVEFYGSDLNNRASSGICLYYLTKDNKKCAIGRFIENPERVNGFSSEYSEKEFEKRGITLNQKIKSLGESFLKECQLIHDKKENWDFIKGKGLSLIGLNNVKKIKDNFCK